METGIHDFLIFAAIAISIALFVVFKLYREVTKNISPKKGFVLAMGAGIIAFSFKVLAVVTLSHLPPEIEPMHNPKKHLTSSHILTNRPSPSVNEAYQWEALPFEAEAPYNNPITPEKVALGKALFYEKRLSFDDSISCASCHSLSDKGGADGLSVAQGIHQKSGTRNTPTVLNAAFQSKFFWDARASSLEEQAMGPIFNSIEMGMPDTETLLNKLSKVEQYPEQFIAAFGDEKMTLNRIVQAIASYERTLISPNTAYDRFVRGDHQALTQQQQRGMVLFEKAGCILCHSGPNFSGASYLSDTGYETFIFPAMAETPEIGQLHLLEDKGIAASGKLSEKAIWRVPSLRNISLTAPYFHNGSVETLEEAVRIMAQVQLDADVINNHQSTAVYDSQWIPEKRQFVIQTRNQLSDQDIKDIVAFLKSLEGGIETEYFSLNP